MPARVEVLIWNFGGLLHFKHFGHAAVRLRDVQGLPESDVYISWWPGARRKKLGGRGHHSGRTYQDDLIAELSPSARGVLRGGQSEPRTGQVQIRYSGRTKNITVGDETITLNRGDRVWVKRPDHVLELPVQRQNGNIWGMDAVRMYEWWVVFSNAPNTQYKAVSTTGNCAAVALYALTAGGAEKLHRSPRAIAFLDPNEIRSYVQDLQRQIDSLNETTAQLNLRIRDNPLGLESREAYTASTDLPTFQEWHTMSERGMRWFDRRKEQVRKIDKLYRKYERLTWSQQHAPLKLAIMVQMMEQVHSHMVNKPLSKKADAIRWLGRRILAVYMDKSDEYRIDPGDWMQVSMEQFAFIIS